MTSAGKQEFRRSGRGLAPGLLLVALLIAGRPAPARVGVPAPASAAEAPSDAGLDVTYLANEGFLVARGGARVLIDALFGPGVSGYPTLPDGLRSRLEQGAGEAAGVTVALASHYHPDHFDPASVGRFLTANPRAVFVSTPQAVALLKETNAPLGRVLAVLPEEGTTEKLRFGEVDITVLNLHHGRGVPITENLGFVVTLGTESFLHFGDTEATMEDFEPYLEILHRADVGLLPFWFLASDWRIDLVRRHLEPREVVAAHLPTAAASGGHFGRWESRDNLLRVIRSAFPKAWIPLESGEHRRFAPRRGAEQAVTD